MTPEILSAWKFLHYASTPETVVMREVYSGLYISWDWSDRLFRIMPDFRKGFPGIILPHTTIGQVVVMVAAMGGDWCNSPFSEQTGVAYGMNRQIARKALEGTP